MFILENIGDIIGSIDGGQQEEIRGLIARGSDRFGVDPYHYAQPIGYARDKLGKVGINLPLAQLLEELEQRAVERPNEPLNEIVAGYIESPRVAQRVHQRDHIVSESAHVIGTDGFIGLAHATRLSDYHRMCFSQPCRRFTPGVPRLRPARDQQQRRA